MKSLLTIIILVPNFCTAQIPPRQLPKTDPVEQTDPIIKYSYLVGDSIFYTDKNYKTGEKYYGEITAISSMAKGNLTVEINHGEEYKDYQGTETHTFYRDELNDGFSLLYYWIQQSTVNRWKTDYVGSLFVFETGRFYDPAEKKFKEFVLGDTVRILDLVYDPRISKTEKHEDIVELGFYFLAEHQHSEIMISPEYLLNAAISYNEFNQEIQRQYQDIEEFRRQIAAKYGDNDANRIINNEYWLGMNREQAYLSLGEPLKKKKTITYFIHYDTWIYSNFELWFQNGTLSSWKRK